MLHISDHALIRYLERVVGIDTEEIRTKMMSETDRIAFKDYEGVLHHGKKSFLIKNGCILSVGNENFKFASYYNRNRDKIDFQVPSEIVPKHINRNKRKKTFKPRSWK